MMLGLATSVVLPEWQEDGRPADQACEHCMQEIGSWGRAVELSVELHVDWL